MSDVMAELRAKQAVKRARWVERVAEVLFNFGLIDEILVEETADFLIHEDWLIKNRERRGLPELSDTEMLLIAKAVACQSTPWPTPLEVDAAGSLMARTDHAVRRDSQLTREESLIAALARAEAAPRSRRYGR